MKTVKKLWSILLVLALVTSLLTGAFVANAADPFEEDTALQNGREYVIVTESDGKYFALNKGESGLGAIEVEVADGKIADAPDSAVWIVHAEDNTVESKGSPGSFIFAGSGGFMTYTGGRAFEYDSLTKIIALHGSKYFMTFDGTTFGQGTKDDACKVRLFGRGDVVELVEKGKLEFPQPASIVKDAKKNDDGSITLAFTSDVHYDGKNLNLKTWLEAAEADVGYIDSMGFCGDMGSAYASSVDAFWSWTQEIMDYMDSQVEAGKVGTAVYTHGNHEWFPSAGGNFYDNYDKYDAAKRLIQVGEAVRTEDYIIYCFGGGEIAKTYSYDYDEEDIATLAEYLKTAPTDIPIFILTHFPLHYYDAVDPTSGRAEIRSIANAGKVIDVLNQYDNIIVLWGHNHSNFDDYYYKPVFPGESIVIDSTGVPKTLNFTYLAAGCTADTEYTGPEAGSAATLNKGLIVNISADKELTYTYYTIDGQKMAVEAPWMVMFRDGVKYRFLDTQYVADGGTATLPEVPEFEGYVFTGWYYWDNCVAIPFTESTPITRNLLVTAGFRYDTGLSTDNVYITIMLADGIAVGKTGTPILQYPVPYYQGITGVKAIQAVQDAEFDGTTTVASKGYGYVGGVWGLDTENTWLMATNSSKGYVSATTSLEAGNCYYILTYADAADRRSASYLKPFTAEVVAGEPLDFSAAYWLINESNAYEIHTINGDVYCGTSLDALEDTGAKAVDGAFALSFMEAGEYIVAVKADGVGLAATKITVTAPVVQPTKQGLKVDGEDKTADIYNVSDLNYFKLRDIAMLLNGTAAQFSVDFDPAAFTVSITTGAAYVPVGGELEIGADLSASCVPSRWTILVNGVETDITAYNIGGSNYFQLAQLGAALGFGVAYDAESNTMLVTSAK